MKFKDWRGDLKRTEILRGWAGQGRRLSGKETGAPGCFAFLRSRALWVLHVDPPFSPACPPAGARFEELLVSVDLAEGAGVLGGGAGQWHPCIPSAQPGPWLRAGGHQIFGEMNKEMNMH